MYEFEGEKMEKITYQRIITLKSGGRIVIENVPALRDEQGEISVDAATARQMTGFLQTNKQDIPAGESLVVDFEALLPVPAPAGSSVSLAIAAAIAESGLTKAEVATQLGISPSLVTRWSNRYYDRHEVHTLRRLAAVLGVPLIQFFWAETTVPTMESLQKPKTVSL
jgi:Helix-turn-helix domain